ncbi:MAG: MucB/RseB C-terminal domain-containing protein [Pseudomonadota bacterium]
MKLPMLRLLGLFSAAWLLAGVAVAQTPAAAPSAPQPQAENRSINDWLLRMHEASRRRTYVGTFVVSSAVGMSSARIWHVCDGTQQIERVEALTGRPRFTFRHNDQVTTFHPDAGVVRSDKRESLGLFPGLLLSSNAAIPDFYMVRQLHADPTERVAGHDADVLLLKPKDNLRFGYRVWSEKKSGLVVKLQTLDVDGTVLEQAAFSELQLDAPVRMDKLAQQMARTEGYRVEKSNLSKTTASAEGWALKSPVAGFKSISCYRRPVASAASASAQAAQNAMQWVFSDGLASVSLFVEPFDAQRHAREAALSIGATQTLTRRVNDWWLTAVGEVPAQTLQAFAQSLERKK